MTTDSRSVVPGTALPPAETADMHSASGPSRVRRGRLTTLSVSFGAGIALLIIWQVVIDAFAANYVARPINVIKVIPDTVTDHLFLSDIASTLSASLEALGIAIVIGVAGGLLIGRLRDLDHILGMYVQGLYALPIIAMVPVMTVWFGYTAECRLVAAVVAATLPITYNVAQGARTLSSQYYDAARTLHVPWWRLWFQIVLPASSTYILGGLDLAIGRALIGAVVAEFLVSIPGLGYYIIANVRGFQQNRAVLALVVLALFVILLRALLNWCVARFLPWVSKS